jgi:preflagellin peptidase FlaK
VVNATLPDVLRLLAIPVFGWAAWRDVETRRVADETWYPLAALAVVLLLWEGWVAWHAPPLERRWFLLGVVVSLGFVAPMVLVFWWFRAFGGADMKAFLVVAALFPTYPAYQVAGWTLPVQQTLLGAFSLTILTNTVLLGALYPVALFVRNLVAGRYSWAMFVGRVTPWEEIPTAHGRLLETPDGVGRNGVDLDAVRMYLRWRGVTLAELRERADELRDPATLPEDPNPPTDGAVDAGPPGREMATDGGIEEATDGGTGGATDGGRTVQQSAAKQEPSGYEDPWGAAAFLDDLDHGAYGTTPTQLREGLTVLATDDEMWVSPGIPFIVPMFAGLVVAFVYGDLLAGLLDVLGVAI